MATTLSKNLTAYYEYLVNAKTKKVPTTEGGHKLNCKFLWIPMYSGNRTATIELNHTIFPPEKDGTLWGANGNCGTEYQIVEIPKHWRENEIDKLANKVIAKMGKSYSLGSFGDCNRRVLKADERMPIILQTIAEMSK